MADPEFRLKRVRYSITQTQWKTMQTFENPEQSAAEANQAQAAELKALEDFLLAPTPGELYGYGDTPLQNEPTPTPAAC